MTSLSRRISVGLTTLGLVLAQVIMPVQVAFATQPANPGNSPTTGNNGTLKVHDVASPIGFEDNEPKVCQFNFEGFDFDGFQDGKIDLWTQGGGQSTLAYGPYIVGPADANGYFVSQNFNTTGGTQIADGMYKATIYSKDTGAGGVGYVYTEKAKSKVFTVDCEEDEEETTRVTAVNGTFADTCGLKYNLVFTPAVTAGVQYIQTRTGNTLTVTAQVTDSEMYTLTNPEWSQSATDMLQLCVITPCVDNTSSTVSKDTDFADYQDTRATGHYEFTSEGLRIWTEGATSTDKAAWYHEVDYSLAEIGAPAIDFELTSGTIEPGMQIVFDADADGTTDGILVGEPNAPGYGNNWWLSSGSALAKAGAPHNGGGYGSEWYGTLDEWLSAFPEAKVMAVGFSLGSGVKADGVLKSITFGCHTWTFEKEVRGPQPCTVSNNTYVAPWTYDNETYPFAGAWPVDAEPATASFTDEGLYLQTPADESYTLGFIDAGDTYLADIDAMSYTTMRDSSSTGYNQTLPAYILLVDIDGNSATDNSTYFFYEPYYNSTVLEDTWQTWNLTGSAKWYESGTGQTRVTWDSLVAKYTDATVTAYGFNQGTDNPGTNAYIKSMTFDCATTAFVAGKGEVPEEPETPVVPTPVTPAPFTPGRGAALPAELPETGTGVNGVVIALLAAAAAYGALYFAQPKRKFDL